MPMPLEPQLSAAPTSIETAPVLEVMARTPAAVSSVGSDVRNVPTDTFAADTVRSPPEGPVTTRMPSLAVVVTVPVATTDTEPVPLPKAQIPDFPPVTVAAVTVRSPPEVPTQVRMPSPATLVTAPVAWIDSAPAPLEKA